MRYKNWLWWTRLGMVVAAVQFIVAIYVTCILMKDISKIKNVDACLLGKVEDQYPDIILCLLHFSIIVFLHNSLQAFMSMDL